jgi:FMN phosphatase YigB (HAD superfamily)
MVKNTDPAITLEECFDEYFYPKLGQDKSDLTTMIEDFYWNHFPALKPVTGEILNAANSVKSLFMAGHRLVIATNPLFPKMAIDHRIEWANLGIQLSDYEYVTNFEELHFTKPRPEFIAEIMGKIGWPDEPVVMIGNEWEMDILPAEQLGIPTFFIGSTPPEFIGKTNPQSSSGSMEDVIDWIDQLNFSESFETPNTPIAITALLRATAANIDSYRKMYSDLDFFSIRPESDEWSLIEIVSHLSDVDREVNIPRLKLIQNQDNAFIEAALTDHWAEERNYLANDPLLAIDNFIENRKNLLEILEGFDSNFWKKSINHAIFGPTTVSELIKFTTQHDRIHLSQIVKTQNLLGL